MPEVLGADWSFAHIDPKLLRAAGYTHAFRYLAPLPNAKVITPTELAADRAAGLTVHFNFEQSATNALGGFAQGYTDGRVVKALKTSLGLPNETVVIYSADFDDRAHANALLLIEAYLLGAESVSGHPEGVYGSIRVIESSKKIKPARQAWQTQAWSGNVVSPLADFYQRTGHTHFVPGVNNTDYDEDVIIHNPSPGGQVTAQFNPAPVIVSLTEFEHPSLGHAAAAVTLNGAVYCSPENAYLGGGNHGASAGKDFEDTGRKAAVIRRPNAAEVAKGHRDGYVIVDQAGETYFFG